MRILFLAAWYPYPVDNGSKNRAYHLIRSLAESHEVSLVAFAYGMARPDEPSPLSAWCQEIVSVPIDPFQRPGLQHPSRFFSRQPIVDGAIPAMVEAVARVTQRHAFDMVIASTTVMATYAAQCLGTKQVLELHNFDAAWSYERYRRSPDRLRRVQRWISWRKRLAYDRRLYAKFDLCIQVSKREVELARQQIRSPHTRHAVVPNGVDTVALQPTPWPRRKANRLIYNGALNYAANFEAMRYFLADIYPELRRQLPAIELFITGDTSNVNTALLTLDDHVTLTGYVEDIARYVGEANVCVVPLLDGGGSRLKVLEALALGTPVVATPKGIEGLELQHETHILVASTPDTFVRYTLQLLNHSEEARAMAQRARTAVESQFDWARLGRRFVQEIEAI